jgi:DNA-binding NarL/FixJ family response regulator
MSEALRLIADTRPDVAVVDISLKTGNGIDLVKQIKDRNDHVRILVWSMDSESLYAVPALRAGALGYINKDQATDRIVEAIRRVLAGKVWLSENMTERMLQQPVGTARGETTLSPLQALTRRVGADADELRVPVSRRVRYRFDCRRHRADFDRC